MTKRLKNAITDSFFASNGKNSSHNVFVLIQIILNGIVCPHEENIFSQYQNFMILSQTNMSLNKIHFNLDP